jgi:UDP-N-acetylmuramate--alanine ligase
MVIDDYAHNPEKLAAAWTTLAAAFPQGICAVWRPHGFAPLRKMLDDLTDMFARVCRPFDELLLLPVYDAGGTADRSVSSADLASRLEGKHVNVSAINSLELVEAHMRTVAHSGRGALITFGARDPGLPRLAKRLAGRG